MRATDLRRAVYGVLAVVGLVGTWYFNLTYSGDASYLAAWFANAASSSAAVDLLVAFTFPLFLLMRERALHGAAEPAPLGA